VLLGDVVEYSVDDRFGQHRIETAERLLRVVRPHGLDELLVVGVFLASQNPHAAPSQDLVVSRLRQPLGLS